ncbi:trimethylamine methyltransferase family protein, partial [Chloroflexota bacterium]
MTNRLRFKLLTDDEVGVMYDKCVEFLSSKGWIKIENHPQALKMLDKAGAQVDIDNKQVRFPKDIIEEALRTVPRSFTLAGGGDHHDLILPNPDGQFYVRGVSGLKDYCDPDSNTYRDSTLADVAEWAQLVEALNEIDICMYLTATDMPTETADIHGLKTLFENTSKQITVQPFSVGSVGYLLQLAQAAAGGAEALKKKPIINMFCCPLVPFVIKDMDMEVIIQCSRLGVPISANPLPNTGGTSPITVAGTVLQSGIEILAVIVMSQLINPGAPVVGQPNFYTIDMASGRCLSANAETHLGSAAGAQFIKDAFHIPTHTWAFGSDSYIPDGQSGIEKALGGLLVAGGGADILAGAGFLNAGKAASPVQLVIDDTIIRIIRRNIAGVKVDEDTMAFQEILNTAPGDHYLDRAHTLQHCRDNLRVELFASNSYEAWEAEGRKDLRTRATDKYKELKKQFKPMDLSADIKKELDRIVSEADQ